MVRHHPRHRLCNPGSRHDAGETGELSKASLDGNVTTWLAGGVLSSVLSQTVLSQTAVDIGGFVSKTNCCLISDRSVCSESLLGLIVKNTPLSPPGGEKPTEGSVGD
jgi:hypothetical protein